jgi:hypothetical protein
VCTVCAARGEVVPADVRRNGVIAETGGVANPSFGVTETAMRVFKDLFLHVLGGASQTIGAVGGWCFLWRHGGSSGRHNEQELVRKKNHPQGFQRGILSRQSHGFHIPIRKRCGLD